MYRAINRDVSTADAADRGLSETFPPGDRLMSQQIGAQPCTVLLEHAPRSF